MVLDERSVPKMSIMHSLNGTPFKEVRPWLI